MYDQSDSSTIVFGVAKNRFGFGPRVRPYAVPLALGLILLLGAVFRFVGVNWDDFQHLHPDERFLTMVETGIRLPIGENIDGTPPAGCTQWGGYFDTQCSPLNPYNRGFGNFVYGTFPLFLVKIVGEFLNQGGYDQIHLVGRYLSGLFDLFSVVLVFFIGRRLYGTRVGLLAALFLTGSVLDIQQSHFFTVDTFANVPLLLAFWFVLDVVDGRGWRAFLLAGVFFGIALAARINLAPFAAIIALAGFMRVMQGVKITRLKSSEDNVSSSNARVMSLGPVSIEVQARRREPDASISESKHGWWNIAIATFIGLGLAAVATFIAFRIAQPYAFKGLGLNPQFLADMNYARELIAGQLDIPPMHQWTARPDYWFPFINMILWGLGPGLGIAGWLGFIIAGFELVRARMWNHTLTFFWVGGLFFYLGQQVAKTDRYYLPLYPFLALLAAYFLVWLWDKVSYPWSFVSVRIGQIFVALVILITVGVTIFWAAAFTSIYTRPVTRLDASRWIYANVTQGSALGNEHWDDPIPMRVDNKDGFGGMYKGIELQWYGEDTPDKREQAIQWLDDADYINLTSNRLYLSIPRLPLRYPMTTKYYEWLFNGQLGFKLVKTFTSRPQFLGIEINDDDAEESFTVYDHPKVLIFQKTAQYSHSNTAALFNSVDLSQVIAQKPLDATLSHNAFQLSASDLKANYSGGTWREIFNPNDLVNQIPVIVWLVFLEIMGLVMFPLSFLVFRCFTDRGYAFAKALGILLLGWGAWTLASYHALPFSRMSISVVLLALVALSAFLLWRQWHDLVVFVCANFRLVLVEEVVFLVFFLFSLLIRFGNPDLWHPSFGGEKPMDFAYLNAIIKTTWFPTYNPWFAGGYINYYYLGQMLSATLVKFTGIVPEVAYNLLLPMFFGLTALGAFGVAFNLVNAVIQPCAEEETQGIKMRPIMAGLLAAFFVLVVGNLGEVGVLANALMKMGQSGNSNLPVTNGLFSLLTGAFAWIVERRPFLIGTGDWYWTATRVIPDTINEFPFFTFLYADLHAHLMALAFALVVLGFALHAVLLRARLQWYDLGIVALVLGALRGINTWDYPVYLAMMGAALVIGYFADLQIRESDDCPARLKKYLLFGVIAFSQVLLLAIPFNAVGVKVTMDVVAYALALIFGLVLGWIVSGTAFDPRELVRTVGWRYIALIALGILFYFPFLANSTYGSGTAYGGVELWKGKRTDLWEYLVVHGIFLFIVATYLFVENFHKRAENSWPNALLIFGLPALIVLEFAFAGLNWQVLTVVFPLGLLAAWLLLRREARPAQRLIALWMFAPLLMTLMVEFIVLKGDIGRMNTVFKFYLQAWVMFSVAGASGLVLVFNQIVPRRPVVPVVPVEPNAIIPSARKLQWKYLWWGAFAVMILAGLLYPLFATWAKVNDRYVPNSPAELNGLNYMVGATYGENGHEIELAPDHAAILWLRENIKGSPVIAEANTGLYRWGNRVSINTGLPTIIGWDWHTKQQYSLIDGAIIDRRIENLRTLYNSADPNEAAQVLKRYNVSYVYVGPLERAVYDEEGLRKFEAMTISGVLTKVYDANDVQIYQVNN